MMHLGEDPFSNGYAAGVEGASENPHRAGSVDRWFWHAGNSAGHQVLCAQLEFILANFPQD